LAQTGVCFVLNGTHDFVEVRYRARGRRPRRVRLCWHDRDANGVGRYGRRAFRINSVSAGTSLWKKRIFVETAASTPWFEDREGNTGRARPRIERMRNTTFATSSSLRVSRSNLNGFLQRTSEDRIWFRTRPRGLLLCKNGAPVPVVDWRPL